MGRQEAPCCAGLLCIWAITIIREKENNSLRKKYTGVTDLKEKENAQDIM